MKLLASLLVLPRLGSSTFSLPAPGSASPSRPSAALALAPATGGVPEEVAPAFFQQGSQQHPGCQWLVHYDEWQPSFEHGVYRGVYGRRAQHAMCLEACCQDPSCTGLQLTSGFDSQCYKYSQVPARLAERRQEARPLGDGRWLAEAPSRWSIFVKAGQVPLPTPAGEHFVPSVRERRREADEAEGLKYAEKALSSVTRTTCNWTVHYGLWTTSFDDGEYEPNNARGGIHCLDACCQDPGCHGLALESLEKYQCYKYSSLPRNMQGGRPLGDGRWLRQMPTKWSVFVKHGVAMTPPVPQLPPLEASLEPPAVAAARRLAPEKPHQEEATHASPPLFTPLLSCIAVGAMAMYVNYYFSSDEILRRLKAKTLRLGLEAHFKQEGRELMPRAL